MISRFKHGERIRKRGSQRILQAQKVWSRNRIAREGCLIRPLGSCDPGQRIDWRATRYRVIALQESPMHGTDPPRAGRPFRSPGTQKARSSAVARATALDQRQRQFLSFGKSSPVFFPITAYPTRRNPACRRRSGMQFPRHRHRPCSAAISPSFAPGDHAANFGRGRRKARPSCHGRLADRSASSVRRSCAAVSCRHLALGNGGRSIGEDIQHPQAAGFDHQLEAARKEIVAHQNRWTCCPTDLRLAVGRPRRRWLSSTTSSCKSVAVWMNSTVAASFTWSAARVAKHPGRRERQQRPQPLAPGLDQMRGHFGNARRVFAGHPLPDQRVHRRHILGKPSRSACPECVFVFALALSPSPSMLSFAALAPDVRSGGNSMS